MDSSDQYKQHKIVLPRREDSPPLSLAISLSRNFTPSPFRSLATSLSKYFHTLRSLKPIQIVGRFWFRLYHPKPDFTPPPPLRTPESLWCAPARKEPSLLDSSFFRFLNQEHKLSGPADWNNPAWDKLWLYNLHYFDDLNAEGCEKRREWHVDLIRRWIKENPPPVGNGWEPYPLSLRIVNWIKWSLSGNTLPANAIHSLAVQTRYLRKRLEYHLLGNHLFANGKALVFAGLFFDGDEAAQWLRKGLGILGHEIGEQILPDGGHFERSPMYHALIFEDLLDLVNLFRVYDKKMPGEWLDAGVRMRAWLQVMTHPDSGIVLFNDAALGIAPAWRELETYAARLDLDCQEYPPRPVIRFPDTGYIRCAEKDAVLFLDVGPIGPDYIPGHGHADTLNFELSLFGQRVIVDSGTSTYEKNEERERQRGTAAHNTVTVDGQDSSEVWGGFRVARRARPFDLEIEVAAEDEKVRGLEGKGGVRVRCSHDGYLRLPGKVIHNREWLLGDNRLLVMDRLTGKFSNAVARYHFHPDVVVRPVDSGQQGTVRLPDGRILRWHIEKGHGALVESTYHPEFGKSIANTCLEVNFDGEEAKILLEWHPQISRIDAD